MEKEIYDNLDRDGWEDIETENMVHKKSEFKRDNFKGHLIKY